MIPYDDLVAALSAWRARQGLPVVQVAGAAPATARPASPPAPPRTAPPNAPPRAASPAAADDFGADALVEDSAYDASGEDYVLSLRGVIVEDAAETTALGGPPEPVAEGVLIPKRGKPKPQW